MIAPPIFQLSIMPSIQIAAENIHCALGSPLTIEKRRNLGVFLTPLRNLQTRAAFIAPFTTERIDDNQKKFIPHLAIENDFFHSASDADPDPGPF
jgi:hypothetical protein